MLAIRKSRKINYRSLNKNFNILSNKIIKDSTGKILFFSKERFEKDIVNGDHCFVCGAKTSEKEFNSEHIIPDWILRKYNLHDRQIYLPNKTPIKYSQYKVPCCKDCNSSLSKEFEEPVSKIIEKGYEYVSDYLKNEGPWLLFEWLSLLFFKTHLKTTYLRLFQDERQPDYKISDLIFWESMHHIHCVVRSFYTHADMSSKVLGSLILVPVRNDKYFEPFDYGDNFEGKGIMIKLGKIGLVSILNDSCGSLNFFMEDFKKITSPVSPLQLREILSRLSFINLNLKERPKFYSSFNNNRYSIDAEIPDVLEFQENGNFKYGDILYSSCSDIVRNLANKDKEFILEKLKEGRYTFLFDEKGKFIEYSMIYKTKDKAKIGPKC